MARDENDMDEAVIAFAAAAVDDLKKRQPDMRAIFDSKMLRAGLTAALPYLPYYWWWNTASSLPKDGKYVITWDGSMQSMAYYLYDDDDGEPVFFNGDVSVRPTHWMPLPEPPPC